jgi:hypothetical protein
MHIKEGKNIQRTLKKYSNKKTNTCLNTHKQYVAMAVAYI